MIVIPLYIVYAIGVMVFWGLILATLKIAIQIKTFTFIQKLCNLISVNILLVISFSELGLAIGLMTGSSLSPVIGAVIPGLLTFFGGIVVYAFLTNDKPEKKEIGEGGLLSIFCISFFFLFGAEISGDLRIAWTDKKDEEKRKLEKEDELFKNELKKELIKLEYKLKNGNDSSGLKIEK